MMSVAVKMEPKLLWNVFENDPPALSGIRWGSSRLASDRSFINYLLHTYWLYRSSFRVARVYKNAIGTFCSDV